MVMLPSDLVSCVEVVTVTFLGNVHYLRFEWSVAKIMMCVTVRRLLFMSCSQLWLYYLGYGEFATL